ncbi:hypothetical protein HDU87_002271 [Geranomyces variabilis]|uniref:Uncharacterized protein n=1 Tax=Geranomyces variabilis TaxID=109894 RepID=A0AAD5TLG6_9FUNG|nr:hypothetical protein HDU87_002271 [Geranomyces variabilis]
MPSPRRPAAEMYTPPHRHRVASQGRGAPESEVVAPPIYDTPKIVHAWDVPQPQAASPLLDSSAAPPRIVHAWETSSAESGSSTPVADRKGRSQERSSGPGRGRGASRSPMLDPEHHHQRHRDSRSQNHDHQADLRPQSPGLHARRGRKGGRGGGGSASVPVSRPASRNRSASRRPNRPEEPSASPPANRRQYRHDLLHPDEAAARTDAPHLIQPWDVQSHKQSEQGSRNRRTDRSATRTDAPRLIQPWEVQPQKHSEERSTSRRTDGAAVWTRLGPREASPPPELSALNGASQLSYSKPSFNIKGASAAQAGANHRPISAPPAPIARDSKSADAPAPVAQVKVTTPAVKIDLQKLRDTANTNWADDDDDDDWQRELLLP